VIAGIEMVLLVAPSSSAPVPAGRLLREADALMTSVVSTPDTRNITPPQ
jgi:hypothetical protein